ncbi:hypothetical protein F5J12DRAFT_786334 [Pisolithus orientalis]|uniref:uncharacterized protein n=1 Tax=Pisolithus orientalis TaxID=936130 RepID=UPI00222596A0|nr:uncharacterized protein F5J12DRAFT_786334 [Pisolithus orientalis]KAI5991693.1 hypothetical protein F5J12DRAFT_786334 [Pisolithus orientalis]
MKQSKNLEEMLVQLHELQEPTPPPIVSSGRVDMAGSNMDIAANSCKSLLDQFLQEREPTAPPADGMNVDLLKQLLNAWEPLAPPVTHEKLNRMDGSSTPAQDITMQVDFLEDLQNVQELSPLPITCESSNPRDQSCQPNSPTNLLAQLQDMREPTPPPLISNVPVNSSDLAVDKDNGTNHLTFGMPKQSEMRDLFKEICNGELPSTQQSLQMEQWGLAPVPHCDQVSHYHRHTTPSDTLFNPTSIGTLCVLQMPLQEHWAQLKGTSMPFIASQSHPSCQSVVEMGILYMACQIEVASVHLKQTANIAGWPMHWFANLAMDLHATMQYLRHQDDELMMAQGLWPLPEVPIADHLDGHIKEQVVGIAWVVGHAASIVYMFLTVELVVYTSL